MSVVHSGITFVLDFVILSYDFFKVLVGLRRSQNKSSLDATSLIFSYALFLF